MIVEKKDIYTYVIFFKNDSQDNLRQKLNFIIPHIDNLIIEFKSKNIKYKIVIKINKFNYYLRMIFVNKNIIVFFLLKLFRKKKGFFHKTTLNIHLKHYFFES